ncbi:MAG: NAD(+)/NADH kinase [Lachnospiraceae bacterium]|nr:NAD(+)/NADH kinase [Lachnospiraceae bacterium]MBQ8231890.1 NAD(+)/NADH kinase [Lachnospiraceae bacterium]
MKHFLIYTNHHKDPEMEITGRISTYLEGKGCRCSSLTKENGSVLEETAIPKDVYCMIVIGGDGTMLQAAWDTKRLDIPLIGVNRGTLGYMTEIEPGDLEEALDKLVAGDFTTEKRMMLHGSIKWNSGDVQEDWALNDIVISRKGSLQIHKLKVYVNGQFLNEYNADGVIVSTPTGSTGYSLSAGGPIVEPKARLIMLTPICPHTLNARSIILSPEDEIVIEVPADRNGEAQAVEASFDGAHMVSMKTGEKIKIVASEKTTEIIQINKVSFLEVLHKKMSDH